jgi:hypothetical protein
VLRPAAFALLAVLATAPASAQIATSACQPHRNGEVRCAVRVDIPGGNRVYEVMINAARAGADARIQTDTYVSNCGSAGRMVGRSNIANTGTSRVATFANERSSLEFPVQAVMGVCVEVFLLNCTVAGQPATCGSVLNLGGSRVELR